MPRLDQPKLIGGTGTFSRFQAPFYTEPDVYSDIPTYTFHYKNAWVSVGHYTIAHIPVVRLWHPPGNTHYKQTSINGNFNLNFATSKMWNNIFSSIGFYIFYIYSIYVFIYILYIFYIYSIYWTQYIPFSLKQPVSNRVCVSFVDWTRWQFRARNGQRSPAKNTKPSQCNIWQEYISKSSF